jgi:predicted negative regulator of RcsB-dependent stress response
MSAYDLEEQEQLAELKAFWKQWGTLIILAIAAILVVLAGFRLWNWYQASQSIHAAEIYGELQKAAAANDARKAREEGGKLIEQHPRTLYAALGALIAAKLHFEAGDFKTARAQLQWAVDNARDPEVRAIARLRLAHVMLDEKAYDDALKVVADKPPAPFEPMFDEIRGDVLFAQGKTADARASYKKALEKLKPEDEATREVVQMKLDGLGGS